MQEAAPLEVDGAAVGEERREPQRPSSAFSPRKASRKSAKVRPQSAVGPGPTGPGPGDHNPIKHTHRHAAYSFGTAKRDAPIKPQAQPKPKDGGASLNARNKSAALTAADLPGPGQHSPDRVDKYRPPAWSFGNEVRRSGPVDVHVDHDLFREARARAQGNAQRI